jgi:hypothetical protein
VAFDIRGDSKIIFINWPDIYREIKGEGKIPLLDQNTMLLKIKDFRKRNEDVIEGIKSKIIHSKLLPDIGVGGGKKIK